MFVEQVVLEIDVAPGTRGKAVAVEVTAASHILCRVGGATVFSGALAEGVVADETVWTIGTAVGGT